MEGSKKQMRNNIETRKNQYGRLNETKRNQQQVEMETVYDTSFLTNGTEIESSQMITFLIKINNRWTFKTYTKKNK